MNKLRKKQQKQQPNAIHIHISFPVIEKEEKKYLQESISKTKYQYNCSFRFKKL